MPVTEKQKQYADKYIKNTFDEIKVRVPKGQKASIQAHAQARSESLNSFMNRAIDETINRDNNYVPIVEQETPTPTQPKPDRRLTFAEVQAVTPFWDDDAHGDHNERYNAALEKYKAREQE